MSMIKRNGIVIFLDRKIEDIIKEDHINRPLLKDIKNVYKLYNERIDFYKKYADIIIENDDILEKVVEKIYLRLKKEELI